jgi:hypothetical protein
MLVIVPVALLTIAALISLMVALVGDVMMARSRAAAVYDLQDTLDRIELISQEMPVVVIATNSSTYEKVISNIQETKARRILKNLISILQQM